MGLFRRKVKQPEPITVEEAIASGLIEVQRFSPRKGFYIRHWGISRDEWNRPVLVDAVDVYYPSWYDWRRHMRSLYLGGSGIFGFRDVPSGMREPMIDLGAGVTEEEYNAARGFLLDKGLVSGPDNVRLR